jgi:hypothetical protein
MSKEVNKNPLVFNNDGSLTKDAVQACQLM